MFISNPYAGQNLPRDIWPESVNGASTFSALVLSMDDSVLIRGPERDENCSLFINRDVIDRFNSCAKHLPIISHEKALQCDSSLYKPVENKSTYKNESPKI